ncbi:GAF domain-like protein [Chlamydoabsidia padenii]|nr:GAF domain-like protein [Chlamydoabsidia padenii]
MKDIGTNTNPHLPKVEFYTDLAEQIKAITEDQTFWVTNLSNASAVIFHELNSLAHFQEKPINWAGFYITDPNNDQRLILGPFQGKVACTEIPFGKGVCGAAASTMETQLVRDVHEFPGHIACDSASNSEIVVPLVVNGKLIGVLDIDCQEKDGFGEEDKTGLETIAKIIINNCVWTN